MNDTGSTSLSDFQYIPPIPAARSRRRDERMEAELGAALARERSLLRERTELLDRQNLLAREFDHRLLNSLQLIASLLSLQSRTATPEAAAQIIIAARRVAAFGRVHHRLHLLDRQDRIELRQYLEGLCEDISGLVLVDRPGCTIRVEGVAAEIPTALAGPLGLIVNELITNAAKYADGNTTVRLKETSRFGYSLSVSDDGPGLPEGFVTADSKGLGMKIVESLVAQIGGKLCVTAGDNGRGACFTVTFGSGAGYGR
jgi:two-component sensor histidine kinase